MKRIAVCASLLVLTGCAGYYNDYYADDGYYYRDDGYYYEDGYHPRSRFSRRFYQPDGFYYDLYDPYLSLFAPFGWIYDPWFYQRYRFGVDLYPFRQFGFAFYGGRPWYYSPWYGGYGLYHPYGWAPIAVSVQRSTNQTERASDAARGLAAGVHGAQSGTESLVRTSAIRTSSLGNGYGALLGTMSVPVTSINGIPVSRGTGTLPAIRTPASQAMSNEAGQVQSTERGYERSRALPYSSATAGDEVGIPLSRGNFAPVDGNWSEPTRFNGMPVDPGSTELSALRAVEPAAEGERLQRWSAPGPQGNLPAEPQWRGQALQARDPGERQQAWQPAGGRPDRGGYGRSFNDPAPQRFEPRQERFDRPHREFSAPAARESGRGQQESTDQQ